MFPLITKHREVGWKDEAQPSVFLTNLEVFGNRSKHSYRVFDVASQTIDNSWRNSKQKFTKFYDN